MKKPKKEPKKEPKKALVSLKVTEEMIAEGGRGNAKTCPVANMLRRQMRENGEVKSFLIDPHATSSEYDSVRVDMDKTYLGEWVKGGTRHVNRFIRHKRIIHSDTVKEWIREFDEGEVKKPITLRLGRTKKEDENGKMMETDDIHLFEDKEKTHYKKFCRIL